MMAGSARAAVRPGSPQPPAGAGDEPAAPTEVEGGSDGEVHARPLGAELERPPGRRRGHRAMAARPVWGGVGLPGVIREVRPLDLPTPYAIQAAFQLSRH